MTLPPAIDAVRRRPGMFVTPLTFDCVVAFLTGYDIALSDGFLVGFREWLITRLDYGNNLAWPGLVEKMLEGEMIPKDESRSIERQFALLDEFIDVRDSRDGLRRIFVEYEQWLHRQDWYTAGHPGSLDPGAEIKGRRKNRRSPR